MLVEEGVVGSNKGAVAPRLGGLGGPVMKGREIEGEASHPLHRGDFGAEYAVDEHEGLEGDDPIAGFLDPLGESPHEGLEEVGGSANPIEHSLRVLVVDAGSVVACCFDYGCLKVRVPYERECR